MNNISSPATDSQEKVDLDPQKLSSTAKLRRVMGLLNTALELVNDENSFQDLDEHFLGLLDCDLRQCRNDVVDLGNVSHTTIQSEYIGRNPRFS